MAFYDISVAILASSLTLFMRRRIYSGVQFFVTAGSINCDKSID